MATKKQIRKPKVMAAAAGSHAEAQPDPESVIAALTSQNDKYARLIKGLQTDLTEAGNVVKRCRMLVESLMTGTIFETENKSFDLLSFNPIKIEPGSAEHTALLNYTRALAGLDSGHQAPVLRTSLVDYIYDQALRARIGKLLASGKDRMFTIAAGYLLDVDYFNTAIPPSVEWIFDVKHSTPITEK